MQRVLFALQVRIVQPVGDSSDPRNIGIAGSRDNDGKSRAISCDAAELPIAQQVRSYAMSQNSMTRTERQLVDIVDYEILWTIVLSQATREAQIVGSMMVVARPLYRSGIVLICLLSVYDNCNKSPCVS